MIKDEKSLYSLIPLADFKAILGLDDRDDKITRFCLLTASLTIEQYCMRHFLHKKHIERIAFTGDLSLPLREYPVSRVAAVFVFGNGEVLEHEFYPVNPNCGTGFDILFSLSISLTLNRYLWLTTRIRN